MKWIWIVLALIYLISPYDLIPGLHLPGLLDDIVVGVLLYRYLARLRGSTAPGQPPHDYRQQTRPKASQPQGNHERSAHEILGVSPQAGDEEIRAAYLKLAHQYHPDKVAHLGDEFQTMAEQRFKEIQEAYDKLIHP